jgi:hypothetical protein
MQVFLSDFPFEEIKTESGDYFETAQDVMNAGYSLSQVWSVIENEDVFTYGPHHHYINLIGFIATKEHHNSKTYYNETIR